MFKNLSEARTLVNKAKTNKLVTVKFQSQLQSAKFTKLQAKMSPENIHKYDIGLSKENTPLKIYTCSNYNIGIVRATY